VKCSLEVEYFRHISEYDQVPTHCGQLMQRVIKAPQIIKDIEPYRAVAADVANGGKPPAIMSRREHREFLKRNNYSEIGSEIPQPKRRTELDSPITELRQAIRGALSNDSARKPRRRRRAGTA